MKPIALRLVAIDRLGAADEQIDDLPEMAMEACAASAQLYDSVGFTPPWIGYLAVVGGKCIGACAFKGPPQAGRVEIAYFTFPEFEGRGFAKRMAQQLVALAVSADPELLVAAQTRPEENASTSVLKRLGFVLAGALEHPEDGLVWEWHYRTHTA